MGEINIGDKVPSFSLPDQSGKTFELDSALGKGPVVLFFYPKDETPGCTAEVCSFRDTSAEFAAAGASVFGISSDSVESHAKFVAKHSLPYPLLADEGGRVRKLFGVPKAMFGLLDGRVTYVLDSAGVVRHRFSGVLRATKHVDEALNFVKSMR